MDPIPDIFEREGVEEHERTGYHWKVEVSPRRWLSKGTGPVESPRKTCGVCGGTKTVCVDHASMFGKEPWKRWELRCEDCGNYTTWEKYAF